MLTTITLTTIILPNKKKNIDLNNNKILRPKTKFIFIFLYLGSVHCRQLDIDIPDCGDLDGKVGQLFLVGSKGLMRIMPMAEGSTTSVKRSFSSEDLFTVRCCKDGILLTGGKTVEIWNTRNAKKVWSDTVEYLVPTPIEVFPFPTLVLAATDEVCLFSAGQTLEYKTF